MNSLASETSFYLLNRVYPQVKDILPETSQSRYQHLKASAVVENSPREWMTNRETLWWSGHWGSLARPCSCQKEHSFLHSKFHFSLTLLKLPSTRAPVYIPYCLFPIGCLSTPLPINPSHSGALPGTCTAHHIPGEQTHGITPGRNHPSPLQ